MIEETYEPNGDPKALDDSEPPNRSYGLMPGMLGYDIKRQKEEMRRKRAEINPIDRSPDSLEDSTSDSPPE